MIQLKCTTSNCVHNLKCHCDAGVVIVDENGRCDSKIRRPGGALEQTFKEIEAAADFLQDAPASVQCAAQCLYNNKGRCSASGLSVADTLTKTTCKTRIKP